MFNAGSLTWPDPIPHGAKGSGEGHTPHTVECGSNHSAVFSHMKYAINQVQVERKPEA